MLIQSSINHGIKIIISVVSIVFLLLTNTAFPVANAITNNQPAIDALGSFDGPSPTTLSPAFNKTGNQDSPNRIGVGGPTQTALDTVHHRLFVNDIGNTRILVFNLDSANKPLDRVADYVLGKPDFVNDVYLVSQNTLRNPQGIAYDSVNDRLFVADGVANRVVVFDTATITNGEDAIHVLGQSTFTTSVSSISQAGLNNPKQLAYDEVHQRLFVPQPSPNRISIFDVTSITNGENAVNVLGQSEFTTSESVNSANGFNSPNAVAYDSINQRLFVADTSFRRILVFDVTTIENGEAAVHVLGKFTFTAITAPGAGSNQLRDPVALAYDTVNQRLFVAESTNNRITVFDVATIVDGENAIYVLGQSAFGVATAGTTQAKLNQPEGLAYDASSGHLYVGDKRNNRIMLFDASTITNGENAVDMIGQYTSVTDPALTPLYTKTLSAEDASPNELGMKAPWGMALDATHHRYFQADSENNRILVFNLNADNSFPDNIPDFVLGQPDFNDSTANISQAGLNLPRDVAYDPIKDRLYVADYAANRVKVYDTASITNGEPAVNILGQSTYLSSTASVTQKGFSGPAGLALDVAGQRLFVSQDTSSRISVFDVDTITDNEDAIAVLGQTTFTATGGATQINRLSAPQGMHYDSVKNRLYVADLNNKRVLIFDTAAIVTGEDAINVLGSPNFTTIDGAISSTAINTAYDVSLDETGNVLFVSGQYRVLIFDVQSITNGEPAVYILGQSGYSDTTVAFTAQSTPGARGVLYDPTLRRLFVSQQNQTSRVTIFDLPLPIFTTVESGGTTAVTEGGTTDTFTVVLSNQPTSNVVFDVTSSDTTAAAVNQAQLTFTNSNWNTPQTITVTAPQDADIVSETPVVTIAVNDAGSDNQWDPVENQVVNIAVTDNDTAGFSISESDSTTAVTEGSTTDMFSVALTAQPSSDVLFDISTNDTNAASINQTSLTFTTANWNLPQNIVVTALHDSDIINETPSITVAVHDAGSDNPWDVLADQIVNVIVTDDDTAGFSITQSSGATNVSEGGTTDSFEVVLTAEPSSDVIFDISSSDTNAASIDLSQLTFTNASWNTPQTVTVTAPQDADVVSETPIITIAVNDAGSDNAWDVLPNQTVDVTVTEDDTAGYTVTESGTTAVSEGSTVDTFDVVLTAQPSTDIVFYITSSDITSATVSVAQLTFTDGNWNTPQTVTVTAPQDADVVSETPIITIAVNDAESDNAWDVLVDQTVDAAVSDDDTAGYTVTESSATTAVSEGSTVDTFDVVLTAQPSTDVVFDVNSSDITSATVSVAQLTFTEGNWNTPQTVTVTAAQDDDIVSETPVVTLVVNDDSSDNAWDVLSDQTVNVTVTDDDSAGFSITETSGATTITEGSFDTFTVTLSAEPSSDVVLDLASSDTSTPSIDISQLNFTVGNWNIPQTVTVTAPQDDNIVGETPTITVSVNDAGSDNAWDVLTDQIVDVTINDDDAPGFEVSATTIDVAESGTNETIEVVLTAQPTSDVVLDIASTDQSSATVSVNQLTFAPSDWDVPQTVTVNAPQDADVVSETPDITVAVNGAESDSEWAPLTDQSTSVMVEDDDEAGFSVAESASTTTIAEGSATDTFEVVLTAQPTVDVVFDVTSSIDTAATVDQPQLIFTESNWDVPQTITVTAPQDANVVDETPVITISVNDAGSDDDWDSLSDQLVQVIVTDDDEAGFAVEESGSNTAVIEEGAIDTFDIILTAQPSSDVVFSLTSNDPTYLVLSPANVTFTTNNWFIPQTITVTALADPDRNNTTPTITITVDDTLSDDVFDVLENAIITAVVTDNDIRVPSQPQGAPGGGYVSSYDGIEEHDAPDTSTENPGENSPVSGSGTLFTQPWTSASFVGSENQLIDMSPNAPWFHAFTWGEDASNVAQLGGARGTLARTEIEAGLLPTKVGACMGVNPRMTEKSVFVDTQGHWAQADIEDMAAAGVIQGVDGMRFQPDRPIFRSETVKIVLEMFCHRLPEKTFAPAFSDIDERAWYAPYITSGKIFGTITGYLPKLEAGQVIVENLQYIIQTPTVKRKPTTEEALEIATRTRFSPQQTVTRAEGVSIVMRSAKIQLDANTDNLPSDIQPSAWYARHISTARRLGLILPSGTFRPEEPISRAEMVRILMNYERLGESVISR